MAGQNELVVALRLVADQFKGELANVDSSLGQFAGAITKFATDWKTASAAVLVSLVAMAKATAAYGEELDHFSQKTAFSIGQTQEWDLLLNRVGLDHQDLTRAFKNFAKILDEANAGMGEGALVFQRLGISAQETARMAKDPELAFRAMADRIASLADGTLKAELAGKLFGERFGIKLIPAMNGGAEAIENAKNKARELGAALSDLEVKNLAQLDDAFDDLSFAIKSLTREIGALVAVPLKGFITELAATIGELNRGPMPFLEGQFIRLTVLAKELGLTMQWLAGGFLLPGLREKLFAELAAIEAEGRAKLDELHARTGAPAAGPKVDTRPPPPKVTDLEAELTRAQQVLKAELELKAQQMKESIALTKGQEAIEEESLKASLGRREITEKDAALKRAGIHQTEMNTETEALGRYAGNLKEFYDKSTALGFANAEQRKSFEADVAKKVSELRQQLQTLGQAGTKGAIADMEAIRAALEEIDVKILASRVRVEDEKTKAMTAALAPREAIAEQELSLLKAKHAEELFLLQEKLAHEIADEAQAARVVLAVRERQAQELAAKEIEAHGGFFANFAQSMKQFVNDTESGFGMARQMAVQTAQAMAQGFQQFFFNVFSGQIQSVKDLLRGMLNFALQVISQVTAQLATAGLLKAGLNLLAPLLNPNFNVSPSGGPVNFGQGGELGPGINTVNFTPAKFASGGSFNVGGAGGVDSQLVAFRASPGEHVQVGQGGQGDVSISITVNAGGGTTQRGGGGFPNLQQLGRSIAKMVEAKIIDEQRPGGLLDGGAPA